MRRRHRSASRADPLADSRCRAHVRDRARPSRMGACLRAYTAKRDAECSSSGTPGVAPCTLLAWRGCGADASQVCGSGRFALPDDADHPHHRSCTGQVDCRSRRHRPRPRGGSRLCLKPGSAWLTVGAVPRRPSRQDDDADRPAARPGHGAARGRRIRVVSGNDVTGHPAGPVTLLCVPYPVVDTLIWPTEPHAGQPAAGPPVWASAGTRWSRR